MSLVFTQPDPKFRTPAYRYLRAKDRMPTIYEVGDDELNPLCRVKLFHTIGRWTYYAYAATEFPGVEGPVLSGFCVSAYGPEYDELGDLALTEIAAMRVWTLPVERDLGFRPTRLRDIEEYRQRW